MELSEPLNVRDLIQRTSKASIRLGVILLVPVSLIALGIGYGISRADGSGTIPTLIWVIIGLAVFFGGACVWSGMADLRHPTKHSAFRWKDIGTPESLMLSFEDDWNKTPAQQKYRNGDYYLTPNWMLRIESDGFNAWPLSAVVWVFASSKTTRVNGITTGTSHSVTIHHTGNKNLPWSIPVASEDDATDFLFALQERVPWAFFGYDAAHYQGWKKDQDSFIAAVKARQAQIRSGKVEAKPVNARAAFAPQPHFDNS